LRVCGWWVRTRERKEEEEEEEKEEGEPDVDAIERVFSEDVSRH
jgi:ribosomal protein L20A (L18A)